MAQLSQLYPNKNTPPRRLFTKDNWFPMIPNLTEPDLTPAEVRSPLPAAFGCIEPTTIAFIFARHYLRAAAFGRIRLTPACIQSTRTYSEKVNPQHLLWEEENRDRGWLEPSTLCLQSRRSTTELLRLADRWCSRWYQARGSATPMKMGGTGTRRQRSQDFFRG